ncbi:hypothetical protein JCM8097_001266 [Rhodosporidiobolus ruineniae]
MLNSPPSLHLPSGSTLVEDVDEEIFLLYTRKQQLAQQRAGAAAPSSSGLGSHSDKEGVLHLSLPISNPWTTSNGAEAGRGKKRAPVGGSRKGKEKEDMTVEVELHQALDALRHRKGDTGSVLWRVSLHLATYLLTQHRFPSPSLPPVLPSLSSSSILELGSGTGFLGIALRSIFSSYVSTSTSSSSSPARPSWTFTDQLANLPLVVRNLRANGIDPSAPAVGVEELDWLAESALWEKGQRSAYSPSSARGREGTEEKRPPDLILACDCIYNPSLSAPLARTIKRHAGRETVVLVASELRDEDALEAFLREWVDGEEGEGWRVVRLGWDDEKETKVAGELAGGQYVVWVGWRVEAGEEK